MQRRATQDMQKSEVQRDPTTSVEQNMIGQPSVSLALHQFSPNPLDQLIKGENITQAISQAENTCTCPLGEDRHEQEY